MAKRKKGRENEIEPIEPGDGPAPGGLLNIFRALPHDAGMSLMDHEVETLMAEAFHPLPVPTWWAGVEVPDGLVIWTAIERDSLRPNRLTALRELRSMLKELTRAPCRIHVYEKPLTHRQADKALRRIARRW